MKTISSNENKIFKSCKQLADKKYRDRLGLYLIEGDNLIEEALKNHVQIEYIVVSDNSAFANEAALLERFNSKDSSNVYSIAETEVFSMPEKLFKELSGTETPQGILAAVRKPENVNLKERLKAGDNVLILDRLQDPGNIGTIIRTADAAGFGALVAVKGTADIFSPKVIRAAAGSVFRLPIFLCDDANEVLALMKALGKRTLATCFDTDNYYYDMDLAKDVAIIIGNEGNGISKEFIDGADIKVKIPMKGNIDSLNAAVAAAILMYETVREVK